METETALGNGSSSLHNEIISQDMAHTSSGGASLLEESEKVGPPEVPPKPYISPIMRPSTNRGAGWLRIVGSYRKGVLQIVVEEFHRLGFKIAPSEVPDDQISVFWSRSFFPKLGGLKPHQKVNWLPGMSELCRKDMLGRNITIYSKRYGDEHFSFWPKSFNLPREWSSFIEEYTARPVPYILKPPLAARGEGIRLFAKLGDAEENDEYLRTKIPLAQRYIPNPLLFHGKYKMSFRFYVALTSVDPLRIYIYQDGLVRICSTPYVNADYTNLLIHLTNYDLQVVNEEHFVNTMSGEETECRLDGLRADWQEVKRMLQRQGRDVDRMWSEIQDLVVKSFIAVEGPLSRTVKQHVKSRGTAYEVTGFDVLLDEDLKPWLLEVNHTPSLCPHTDLENDIKRHMLRDLYQLVDVERKHTASTRLRHDTLLARWQHEKQLLDENTTCESGEASQSTDDPKPVDTEGRDKSCVNDTNGAVDTTNGCLRPVSDGKEASGVEAQVAITENGLTGVAIPLPIDISILDTGLSDPPRPSSSRISEAVTTNQPLSSLNGSVELPTECQGAVPATEPRPISAADGSFPCGRRLSVASSASSTTAFHPHILEFPIDQNGDIIPDRFVASDLWTILDSAAEVRCLWHSLRLSFGLCPLFLWIA